MAVELKHHPEVNPLLPTPVKIIKIIDETGDVKNFHVQTERGEKPFNVMPGQLAMVSIPAVVS